jgi:phosphoribosyl-ATP pyrophosphohydrolase
MKSFNQLYEQLSQIASTRPAGSNSAQLLELGVHAIGKKLMEEAGETWIAAEYQTDEQLALEASQLIYHLQLLLIARGVPLSAVEEKL